MRRPYGVSSVGIGALFCLMWVTVDAGRVGGAGRGYCVMPALPRMVATVPRPQPASPGRGVEKLCHGGHGEKREVTEGR
jgi:hypothetical protein